MSFNSEISEAFLLGKKNIRQTYKVGDLWLIWGEDMVTENKLNTLKVVPL